MSPGEYESIRVVWLCSDGGRGRGWKGVVDQMSK